MNQTFKTEYGKQYFETVDNKPGLNRLSDNTCRIIDFGLLVLQAGQTYEFQTQDREYGLDVLTGTVNIEAADQKFENMGGRQSVFDALPSGAYVGCQSTVKVTAVSDAEIALGSCPSNTPIAPYAIRPETVSTGQWGENQTARHYRYLVNADKPSERLWFAEVFVQDGRWATYPPHKHEDVPEDLFQEEMYFYKVDPACGFGFCGQFEGQVGSDYAFMIRNNTIHKMPCGYHTVTAAPGYKVWYLAVFAGNDKRHRPSPHPDHQQWQENPMIENPR